MASNENTPANPPQRAQYVFSDEEIRVIKECNSESFFKRCIPFGFVFGTSTYAAIRTGYLKGNPRFGAIPKVTAACLVAYFLGKVSYQPICAEKLMKLPNSELGEVLRKRRQGTYRESSEPGFGPGVSLGPFGGITAGNTYSDIEPSARNDLDSAPPQFQGLDDSHRPSLDNPVYEEEMPPVQKNTTTYDELRKQNRDEYAQKRTVSYREPFRAPPPTTPTPTQERSGQRNIYGDLME